MIEFFYHEAIKKEIKKLQSRYPHLGDGLASFERLCQMQFHPENPKQVIAPAKIHRVTQNDLWSMWKIELVVRGLRPNQFPRMWFVVKGSKIAFLCIGSHIDNYDNNEMDRIAVSRVSDIF